MKTNTTCAWCKGEANPNTMSYFSKDTICSNCKNLEEKHPMYGKAQKVEIEQIKLGNFNYEGIGVPNDLREMAINNRKDREK